MDSESQRFVRRRAGNRCEYCQFPEVRAEAPFHLDHVIARQRGGGDIMENLALACCSCNRHKGPNLSGIDPESGNVTALFHPRRDVWQDHFAWEGATLKGRTATGRATVHVLRTNRSDALAVSAMLMQEGLYRGS